jgi:uncharacterized protein (DUF2336 family)
VSDAVVQLAEDPDPDVRLALIHTARELQPEPRRVIELLSEDADPAVNHAANLWLMRSDT